MGKTIKTASGEEMEYDDYVRVVDMSAEHALAFWGAPPDTRIEDGGPADPTRYRAGARVWLIYPDQKKGDRP